MTYDSIEGVEEAVSATAPKAEEMTAITEVLGELDHAVWFDPDTGRVLHGWRDLDDSSVWRLDVKPAAEAEEYLTEQLCLVLDRLRQPELYRDCAPGQEEKDLKVLEELQTIQLAALRAAADGDPVTVDRVILNRIERHKAEAALLRALRGRNLQDAYGTDRGAASRAGRDLTIGRESARRVLDAPAAFAARVREDARDARQGD